MADIPSWERELLEAVRQHISNEKEIRKYQYQAPFDSFVREFAEDQKRNQAPNNVNREKKPVPANENVILPTIETNFELELDMLEIIREHGPVKIHNLSELDVVRKIRDGKTLTKGLYNLSFLFDVATGKVRSIEDLDKLCERRGGPESNLDDALDEFYRHYMEQIVGGDPTEFVMRRRGFGGIIVTRDLPSKFSYFLDDIRECYLLGRYAAAIGLCRVLIEVACQAIYDKIPQKQMQNIIPIGREEYISERIKAAVNFRLGQQKETSKRIATFSDDLRAKWKKASDILHGKMPGEISDDETLDFVKEVFYAIEKLY